MNKEDRFRKVKIDMIIGKYDLAIEWFNDIWSKMHIIETDVYHNDGGEFIFYNNIEVNDTIEERWIFYMDINLYDFWCDYLFYWTVMEEEFEIKSSNISTFTSIMMEDKSYKNLPELVYRKKLDRSGLIEIALKGDNYDYRL